MLYIKPEETQLLHCDAVLIEGSCSIDESILTGESYPITKVTRIKLDTRKKSNEIKKTLMENCL